MSRSRDSGVGIRESESRSCSLQTDTSQALAAPVPGLPAPTSRRHFLGLLLGSAATLVLPLRARAAGNYDFWFTRLRYDSGDWDVDARMPSNLITSLIDYTQLRVDPQEHVLDLADPRMLQAPFCYLAGHKLVEFNPAERRNFERYVRNGGFVFVDDCNHDIDGLFATSFEAQMVSIFGKTALQKLPKSHRLYNAFFKFPDGPPATSFELNGWGDDLVHDYLKGISIDGRLGVLYSNKDYGCEWDYDWRNKRFLAEDNTRFGVNIVMYALTN
ncbi:DUF4159 domain-containing protein [Xanthomonas hortorum]|uniref:DUF4159 domain-containing protein n=1 Tax=Xanthomonas hortorum pv. pelargonii TaxID=453602 RepID=A0A6V7BB49_9XANT|nr:DUF4159 domain-containing protein [Xanthomonas hortorum]MCE4355569.1 DUF4159 domain-containing protein [Xanthomonas hortorum pv. pelargonii]MCM5526262.1 DUF4159 domain-containing protein [Xanthomonas hortorum pv. pelargonii]MCM5538363.1 DUF4159 domain-containing protein [Xanthomonas hortorum pv. pelargonii]MCM5542549.1 DUF4159 domain-containing protein [Xanthomonas hortorum pv. pelargonii]MCM5546380.1 DUF4159 domain-containing protein [Xanthomonas hortorum pv. pelargonii]